MAIKIHLFRWWLCWVLTLTTATASIASLGGAATMGTNNSIAQTGDGVGLGDVQWGRVGESALIGGISGFAGGAAGHWAANSSVFVNGINSPIARTLAVAPLASGAGHLAGGTASGVFKGQGFSMAFNNSFKGLGKSMLIGTGIGVASTVGVSYANGINPINGKPIVAKSSSTLFKSTDDLIGAAGHLKPLSKGELQGFVKGNAQQIHQSLTEGGRHIRGNLYMLKDGTYINLHNSTKTGVPTIDINRAGQIYKIRVQQ